MGELRSKAFQKEVLDMLKPKIKSVLNQTDVNHREDLEQEIFLMIIKVIKEKTFKKYPKFFELMEQEGIQLQNADSIR